MDNDFSEKLSALLSDPAMLSKIAGIAGSLGVGAMPQQTKEQEHVCPTCPAKDTLPCGNEKCMITGNSGNLSETSKNIACSRALLQALKPYLSKERCERIDKILGMMKIAEIMGYLK